jgi:hypothetical protein
MYFKVPDTLEDPSEQVTLERIEDLSIDNPYGQTQTKQQSKYKQVVRHRLKLAIHTFP